MGIDALSRVVTPVIIVFASLLKGVYFGANSLLTPLRGVCCAGKRTESNKIVSVIKNGIKLPNISSPFQAEQFL